jgi:hypothetical protein
MYDDVTLCMMTWTFVGRDEFFSGETVFSGVRSFINFEVSPLLSTPPLINVFSTFINFEVLPF